MMHKKVLFLRKQLSKSVLWFCFCAFLSFSYVTVAAQSTVTLLPSADAYVRSGSYAAINYGKDTSLGIKGSTVNGYTRLSYLKFSLDSAGKMSSVRLRIYGRNTDNTASINFSIFGVDNDTWTENGINWNNMPAASTTALSSAAVNDQAMYYELDVTNYVKAQSAGDKVVSFLIKDLTNQNKNLLFNSKENAFNSPQLVITAGVTDTIPPVVNILFNDSSKASSTYDNQVNITINSSDEGGSGLAFTEYSLNGTALKTYNGTFIIDTAGNYTIKAKATDRNGNVFVTGEMVFNVVVKQSPSVYTLIPVADAFVRNGTYAAVNYGNDTSLLIKGSASSGFLRTAYLKFSLDSISKVTSAKLRIYGRNIDNTLNVEMSLYGIDNDTWTETGINFNNAPGAAGSALNVTGINDQAKYYEFDVTNYIKAQFSGDRVAGFLLKDLANQNRNLLFNSRENKQNQPQLVIETTEGTVAQSNALLFVENPDKFPANNHFVFSRVQIPWSRDTMTYNANHDSLKVRIHNKGVGALTVKNLVLSNVSRWKIEKLKGAAYDSVSLPIIISSGSYADLMVKFIAVDQGTRVKVVHDTLTIISNDDNFPKKTVYLSGIWQKKGEGSDEPYAQEIINAFGFKTSVGFGHTDADKGDSSKLKGNEIKPSYFVRADTSRPVSIRQMSAYHGCCTQTENIMWHIKGSNTVTAIFSHYAKDAQSVLPRKTSSTIAAGEINPVTAFGFKVGYKDWTDASKNPEGRIGIRVWKAIDANGTIIPNAYILANDYLGSTFTNYDYNDNTYFIENLRPEDGAAFFSALSAAPSAVDFGEKVLQTTNSLTLNLSSLGKTYSNGSADPAITISSVAVVGENKSEFTVSLPAKTTLNPQEATTLTVNFNPASQGLKIADLLVYYNNSQSPLRVPLYGIAKASGTAVTANYRVNSGSSTAVTINGKTWSADNQYSFDNLEPYTNAKLTQIAGTDEDVLYLKEQSSNGDKKPFRYEFPVANGEYGVRLHFAELYWGTPGSGLSGGAGSRVMSVAVENQLKLINLDVSQEVGSGTALVKNIPVTVTDGKLNIDFSATVNRPMVVAVEVYSFRAAAAKPAQKATESIAAENTLNKVRVYPNPVQKTLNLQFPASYAGSANLQISDASGRIYPIGKVSVQPGATNTAVNISGLSLKPGFYYLRILSETRLAEVVKLIVE